MELFVRKFAPPTIEKKTISMIGARAKGKTMLVKDLLRRNTFEHIELVSTTGKDRGGQTGAEKNHHQYSGIIRYENIRGEYTDAVVKSFIEKQIEATRDRECASHACIVFEDCLFDEGWTGHSGMRTLFNNNCALRSTVVMVMQYPTRLSPDMRSNLDYVFLFRAPQHSIRKRLYEDYATIFPTFKCFCQAFEQVTSDPFACMVIDNTLHSTRLEDVVSWYKVGTGRESRRQT
jgi:hypothetical protein